MDNNDWASWEAAFNQRDTAVAFLQTIHYPAQYLPEIAHAIAAHSFSANIRPHKRLCAAPPLCAITWPSWPGRLEQARNERVIAL
jgi:hypothetical protein